MRYIITVALITLFDQLAKLAAINYLKPIGSAEIMPGMFYLTYAENTGAAFSILKNSQTLLIFVTGTIACILTYYLFKTYKSNNILINYALSAIIGGALGNLIDRFRLGYVVDFFNFSLIKYPIFNTADVFIVVGAITLAYAVVFDNNSKDTINGDYNS